MFVTILLALFAFWTAPAKAQVPTVIDSVHAFKLPQGSFQVIEDPSHLLTIDEVVRRDHEGAFAQSTWQYPPASYTDKTLWLKLLISNESQTAEWYFDADSCLWSTFEVYIVDAHGVAVKASRLPKRYPLVRLDVDPGMHTLYVRLKTPDSLNLNFALRPDFFARDNTEDVLVFIMAGCIFSLIIYNLFLYVSLRDQTIFYYLLHAVVQGLFAMMTANFPQDFYNWHYVVPMRPLASIAVVLFSQAFFQLKDRYPRLNRIAHGLNIMAVVFMVLAFFIPEPVIMATLDGFFTIVMIMLIALAVYMLKQGYTPARYYLQGMGIYFLGIVGLFGVSGGLLPPNYFTLNLALIGQTCEMFLMSLALANRIKLLQDEKMRADVVAQYKSRLLRVVSHDIASPLSVVTFVAKNVAETHPTLSESMGKMLRSVDSVLKIRDFVLKNEKVTQSRAVQLQQITVAWLFDQLKLLFENQAKEKDIQLKFHMEQPLLLVTGDKMLLVHEIFGNLLSNAIKFSHAGSTIDVVARENGADRVLITVEDKGVGIAAEYIPFLFDPQGNLSTPGTAGEKGNGFGLSLAASYVETLGGKIHVDSRHMGAYPDHHGTVFSVWLIRAASA